MVTLCVRWARALRPWRPACRDCRPLALAALIAAAAALLCTSGRTAADCIDYEDHVHPMGGVDTPRGQLFMAVSGTHAYVAQDYESGLYVIDISDPDHPRLQGGLDVGARFFCGIAAQGNYVYAMQYDYGRPFYVIDVADPANPHVVGSVGTGTTSWGVAVSGRYAYVGYGTGIMVLDVSNPTLPTIVADIETPGGAWAVAVSGERLYAAAWLTGLVVIDISDPENPQVMGIADTPGRAWVVTVSGTIAYVGESDYSNTADFCVVDVADPYNPRLLGTLDVPGFRSSVYSIAALSGRVCMTTGEEIHYVDTSDPENPSIVATMAFPPYYYPACAAVSPTPSEQEPHVYVSGYVAYDPLGSTGCFQVVSLEGQDPIEAAGSCSVPCCATAIAVQDAHAFISAGNRGLQVVDAADPHHPAIVGAVDTPHYAADVAVAGKHAYVVDLNVGLQVIDISDPRLPQIVGSLNTPGEARGVAISGRYAYVADRGAGLQVIDVSNPAHPEIVANVDTPGNSYDVAIHGAFAYIADGGSGLQVIAITHPEHPRPIGSEATQAYKVCISPSGDYAYTRSDRLHVIDISNPANPWRVGSMDVLEDPGSVAASCGHVYLTSSLIGLQVVDVSNPSHPRNIGYADMVEYPFDVAVSDSNVFVVDQDACGNVSGLRIFPKQCEPTITPRFEQAVALSGSGLSAFPNPITGGAGMRLSVQTPGLVRATIWDVNGRLVRTLHDGIFPVGPQVLRWDGRDGDGHPVAAGIYWIRVATPETSMRERLVVLR